MRIKSFTAALALPTMKVNTDSQPTTKRNNELVLLRRIIAESKCFRRPATETTSSRHGCSDSAALLAGVYKISADFGASHSWGRRCT
jgi:hypothetical protein